MEKIGEVKRRALITHLANIVTVGEAQQLGATVARTLTDAFDEQLTLLVSPPDVY